MRRRLGPLGAQELRKDGRCEDKTITTPQDRGSPQSPHMVEMGGSLGGREHFEVSVGFLASSNDSISLCLHFPDCGGKEGTKRETRISSPRIFSTSWEGIKFPLCPVPFSSWG